MIKVKLRAFVNENLLTFDEDIELGDSDNMFKLGYVNSLFAMKLLTFIEKEFSIKIESSEMELSNFSSIDNLYSLVTRKTGIV